MCAGEELTLVKPSARWCASGLEQGGELLGVDLGVVAVAVVEQHVGLPGVAGQGAHLGRPLLQLGIGVAVAEPLVDVLAIPLVRVAMHADDGQIGRGGGQDRRDRVAVALRHVHAQKLSAAEAGSTPQPIVLTPELLQELRVLLTQTTVSEEQPEKLQITETASGTSDDGQGRKEQPTPDTIVFPDVPEEERNKVIAAFKQGIPRREICSYLRWGNAKYSTIVKPVLDSYEHQAGTQEQETPC